MIDKPSNEQRYYDALKRIASYQTSERQGSDKLPVPERRSIYARIS